jgi:hypothetical protein
MTDLSTSFERLDGKSVSLRPQQKDTLSECFGDLVTFYGPVMRSRMKRRSFPTVEITARLSSV